MMARTTPTSWYSSVLSGDDTGSDESRLGPIQTSVTAEWVGVIRGVGPSLPLTEQPYELATSLVCAGYLAATNLY